MVLQIVGSTINLWNCSLLELTSPVYQFLKWMNNFSSLSPFLWRVSSYSDSENIFTRSSWTTLVAFCNSFGIFLSGSANLYGINQFIAYATLFLSMSIIFSVSSRLVLGRGICCLFWQLNVTSLQNSSENASPLSRRSHCNFHFVNHRAYWWR